MIDSLLYITIILSGKITEDRKDIPHLHDLLRNVGV